MFRFADPHYFWLLALIPLLTAVFVRALGRRRKRLEAFGNPEVTAQLMPEASVKRSWHKFVLAMAALALLVGALARPQLGHKLREVKREGAEIMFVVDVSNSMLAQDFEPSRLERTKYAISRLTESLGQDRIGIILFAGDAYVQLPITSDYVSARTFISDISVNSIPVQGTAIGKALAMARNSFSSQSEGSRAIILISDGENHEDDALKVAEQIAKETIPVYTIGVGSPEGAAIYVEGEPIRDENGEMVVTKLNEQMLQEIALATGGAYIRAGNRSEWLDDIVKEIRTMEKKQFSSMAFEEYNEQYHFLLLAALAALVAEFLLMDRKSRLLSRLNIFNNLKN